MIKKIILLTTPLLFVGSFVSANTYIIKSDSSVPVEVQKYVSEEDLVEVLCYEAKWKGAEGLAKVEALNQVLIPAFRKADVSVDGINLVQIKQELSQKMESICSAKSLSDANQRVDEYKEFSNQIREKLQGSLGNELRGIESDFKRRGEELREKLEGEFGREAERLAKEAEERLRSQGEAEGRKLEGKLRELSSEFKNAVIPMGEEISPGEVVNKARRLSAGFSADDPEINSFLSSKFQEILSEATSLASDASAGNISPGQAQSRAQQRVPGVVSEIRNRMEERYRELGRQEEQRIRQELQQRADTIAGEEKEKLEEIRGIFENIDQDIESAYQLELNKWKEYEQKALQKRKEIIVKVIDANFAEAIKMFESKKDQIDLAVAEGVAQDFGIVSYEQLMNDIDKDREEIAREMLSSKSITSADIVGIQERFGGKWNDYRKKMEVIEFGGPEKIIEEILARHNIKFFADNLKRVKDNISRIEKDINSYERIYSQRIDECKNHPNYSTSPTSKQLSKCISCLSLEYVIGEHKEKNTELFEELKAGYDSMNSLVNKLKEYENNPPGNFVEAINFKNELQSSYNTMNAFAQRRDELGRESNRILLEKKSICESLTQ